MNIYLENTINKSGEDVCNSYLMKLQNPEEFSGETSENFYYARETLNVHKISRILNNSRDYLVIPNTNNQNAMG